MSEFKADVVASFEIRDVAEFIMTAVMCGLDSTVVQLLKFVSMRELGHLAARVLATLYDSEACYPIMGFILEDTNLKACAASVSETCDDYEELVKSAIRNGKLEDMPNVKAKEYLPYSVAYPESFNKLKARLDQNITKFGSEAYAIRCTQDNIVQVIEYHHHVMGNSPETASNLLFMIAAQALVHTPVLRTHFRYAMNNMGMTSNVDILLRMEEDNQLECIKTILKRRERERVT